MNVEFFGVRGSHPVTGAAWQTVGGNTSCALVTAAGRRLILDAGTGLIAVARRLFEGGALDATLLFSHYHHDHLAGLSYFPPLFVPTARFTLVGPRMAGLALESVLDAYLAQPFSPFQREDMGAARVHLTAGERHELLFVRGELAPCLVDRIAAPPVPESEIEIRIRILAGLGHPRNGINIYRIESEDRALVYATDTEGFGGGDQRLIQFARGADLLIHDAMYTHAKYVGAAVPPQGWGHSTPEMAIDVAVQAGVKRLCLFHHDPANDDAAVAAIEASARAVFPSTVAAREGLVISL